MDPRIYRYAMSGDTNSMRKLVKEDQLDLTLQLTVHSNNALHIAAQHGHRAFAEELIRLSPYLLFRSNFDGDLPLHVAAREGHMELVDILIDSLKNIANPDDEVTDLESTDSSMSQAVWLKINLKGNTVLHEAMRFRHTKVAMALLGFDPRLADGLNHAGESPLYLACELRMMVVVERILSCGTFRIEGLNGRTPLHASAISGHYGITPFFVAIQASRPRTTCMILDYCPDIGELRDRSGKNALHISIRHNSLKKLEALMKRPELGGLVNKPDNDGNTPLHTATKYHVYRKVKLMLDTHCVDLRARNEEGLTALDVSELGWEVNPRQISVRKFLLSRGAVRSQFQTQKPQKFRVHPLNRRGVDLKSFCETMSLVAVLLATISFAAAFTLPGGYNSDDPNKGHATLIKKLALKAFLLSDTITFCSSLTLAILMLCGTLGDLVFLRSTAIWCELLLTISLYGSLVAFGTGVYVVISDQCMWLAIIILLMVCSVPIIFDEITRISSKMTPFAVRLQKGLLGQSMKRSIDIVQNTVTVQYSDSEPSST
ncbi:Ankyrin repeat-containing protein [Acorus calamus]|uniref:Ankyrin repeat-containing protein n=1 Tax=Acorus calamus TaxID=4465 RepID=A0AAV9C5I4_ACOCL|nr:Ankyrin repeat-containing protein [Acorus calamus]